MAHQALACRAGAGLSTAAETVEAAREAARSASAAVAGAEVDLAFCFLSPAHLDEAEQASAAVREELEPRHLLGCVAEGVVAGRRELEAGPAIAVWAASLPDATIRVFHANAVEAAGGMAIAGFPRPEVADLVLLLADPFTFPVAPFLATLNETGAAAPVVGGLAVGRRQRGEQALLVDDEAHPEGAVGAVVSGVAVLPLVSQGCRPLGRESVVTRCEGNVVHELAGRPALERLRAEIASLTAREQALAAQGILAGIVVDENRPEYDVGDYLMRGVLGADERTGALVLGETVRVGQTVRFFARDPASADADLRRTLSGLPSGARPAGALLFTCNGRGTRMFPEPDHDARLASELLGTEAVAGFFCGGEIGPVGGRAFLHGFTATLAVFLER
ncbi:MAG TPA: FIST N-terminal domain-containing protein [Gaiellaceae bacterium]|nr:FIST N-terminal domain-containing protein [Gaiellaceae bacterium]